MHNPFCTTYSAQHINRENADYFRGGVPILRRFYEIHASQPILVIAQVSQYHT